MWWRQLKAGGTKGRYQLPVGPVGHTTELPCMKLNNWVHTGGEVCTFAITYAPVVHRQLAASVLFQHPLGLKKEVMNRMGFNPLCASFETCFWLGPPAPKVMGAKQVSNPDVVPV